MGAGPWPLVSVRQSRANHRSQLSTRATETTLAPMNWRRGLLLAGINVPVALPMVAFLAVSLLLWKPSISNWKSTLRRRERLS